MRQYWQGHKIDDLKWNTHNVSSTLWGGGEVEFYWVGETAERHPGLRYKLSVVRDPEMIARTQDSWPQDTPLMGVLYASRSRDGGATWSEAKPVMGMGEFEVEQGFDFYVHRVFDLQTMFYGRGPQKLEPGEHRPLFVEPGSTDPSMVYDLEDEAPAAPKKSWWRRFGR